jgi:hypothetical protein
MGSQSGISVSPSDKGRFTQETIAKLGSLQRAATCLRTKPIRDVFLKFLDRSPNKKGVFDDGALLKNDRRYLDFIAIQKCGANEKVATELIAEMVRAGVFKRGFLFRCEKCLQADWYDVATVTNTFACKRCGTSQSYTQRHWLHPEEPRFFYMLDEIVYQALLNGCAVTIIALDHLRQRSKHSFLFTSEVELKAVGNSKSIEIDLAAVVDGTFTLGEAKTEGRLGADATEEEKNIRKYGTLAQDLSAEHLLFATIDDKWTAATMERAERILQQYDVEPEFLTANQLEYL